MGKISVTIGIQGWNNDKSMTSFSTPSSSQPNRLENNEKYKHTLRMPFYRLYLQSEA